MAARRSFAALAGVGALLGFARRSKASRGMGAAVRSRGGGADRRSVCSDSEARQLCRRIHDCPPKVVYAWTGAGTQALWWLHSVDNSSRTVLEAIDLYCTRANEEFLGALPMSSVARDAAIAMAGKAFHRARVLETAGPVLGVSCTASISTERPRRGRNQCWVAVQGQDFVTSWHVEFTKNARTRVEEDGMVSELVIRAMAQCCGEKGAVATLNDLLLPEEALRQETFPLMDQDLSKELLESKEAIAVLPNGKLSLPLAFHPGDVVLCGSFNPLHKGHLALAKAASRLENAPAWFELSVKNADKGGVDIAELQRRVNQFQGKSLLITQFPLFAQKAEALPGAVFVVGHDTYVRLVDEKYYNDGAAAAFERFRELGCRFLVAGRLKNSQFLEYDETQCPPFAKGLFKPLPDVRVDISSTELRRKEAV